MAIADNYNLAASPARAGDLNYMNTEVVLFFRRPVLVECMLGFVGVSELAWGTQSSDVKNQLL